MNVDGDKSVADKVLESIKAGRIKKFSGRHFVFRSVLRLVIVVLVSLVLLHVVAFIHLMLRRSGVIYAPYFGVHGWLAFFGAMPVLLILISIIFLIVLLTLIRHHPIVYRHQLMYSTLAVVLVTIFFGHLIGKTNFHSRFLSRAETLPVIGRLYRHYNAHRSRNAHRGEVMETNENGFRMKNQKGEILTVIIRPNTRLPDGTEFEKGDEVFVFGNRNEDTVSAFGVHKILR